MTSRWLVVALVGSVLVNVLCVFTLLSWRREAVGHHPPPMPVPADREQALARLQERFRLTDEQLDTMRALQEFRHEHVRPVHDGLQRMQHEMLDLLQAPALDRPAVDSLLGAMVAARDSLERLSLGMLLRVRAILTQEQLAELPRLFGGLQQPGPRPGSERPGPGGPPPPPGGQPPPGPGGR
jgi:Spy/CpxP family protein refolding chaperone